MARTAALGFKVEPDLKAALEQAAAEDQRSVSSLVVKILSDWVKARDTGADVKR